MERTRFDINAGCTIDETGLIVSHQYSGTGTRSSKGCNAGKKYFEVGVKLTPEGTNFGLCDSRNNLNSTGGPSASSMCFSVFSNMYRITYGATNYRDTYYPSNLYTNPSIVGMAVDFDKHYIKIAFNGVVLIDETYSDKIEQVGEILYPFVFTGGSNNNATTEFNFGAKPFAYPVPEGYQAWDNVNQRLYLKGNAVYGMK